ncbi:Ribonuclease R [Candidatus Hartigia pinicola]|nr:Ribonuclease R [Candidatus Hartigia pinicola]
MLYNPFQDQKIQEYDQKIPSRELILELLSKRTKLVSREEIAQLLNLSSREELEALKRRLRAMERDSQVVFTRSRCYTLPENLTLLKGKIIAHREGYGFLRVECKKEDYYLSHDEMKRVLHGDIVLAQSYHHTRKGRTEVRIIRVLKPRNNQIVGRYLIKSGIGFVVPHDNRLSFNIFVPKDQVNTAHIDNIVVVELVTRPRRHSRAVGKIIKVLGESMNASVAVDIALRTHEIPYLWSTQVEKQLSDFSEYIPESAKKNRVDLRHLPLVTIDSEDARDFDDAVYCTTKKNGGWRLWVAIADVSYYVRQDTPLDNEARSRGNSVYFPLQVVPMLPEVLSNGLCSLNQGVDRLCMVCEMTVSASGYLSSYKFYEAIMTSYARLTYTKVWKLLQGDYELRKYYISLVPHIESLYKLYQVLDAARINRGAISFKSEEAKFIFNAENRIERIEPVVRNDAHNLIEECMILANIAAARFIEKNKEPALYRSHDFPQKDSIMNLRAVFNKLGLILPGGTNPQPKDYAQVIHEVSQRPDHELLQTMILRSMKHAVYDPKNRGHFGLSLKSYAHFTSPIRRYSDLTLHRCIKYLLVKKKGYNNNCQTHTGGFHTNIDNMVNLGKHCSLIERRSDEATRDVVDWLKCDFMQNQVGKVFTGLITSVTGFGFFVRLHNLFIDGLVHLSTLNDDCYYYDAVGQQLIGELSCTTYRLCDEVKIRVAAVNMDERTLDFSLISTSPKVKHKVQLSMMK